MIPPGWSISSSVRGGGADVERINAYVGYWLGVALGTLSEYIVLDTITYAGLAPKATLVQQAIEPFIADYRIPLYGSKQRGRQILALLEPIRQAAQDQATAGNVVSRPEREQIWNEVAAFQNVFQTECVQLALYLVSDKKGWNMAIIADFAEYTLSAPAWAALTSEETADIRAAGRCLAFEVPTAAAFHFYRFLESFVLKYMPILGVTLKDSDRNLGNYIRILKDKGVDQKVATLLDHIREQYRNPAIHPGEFFDVDGASSQFALVQSAAHMIVEDLKTRLGPDFIWPAPKRT